MVAHNSMQVNAIDARGRTPLHLASSKGRADVAKFLTSNGADVDAADNDGYKPVQLATDPHMKAMLGER